MKRSEIEEILKGFKQVWELEKEARERARKELEESLSQPKPDKTSQDS